MRSGLPQLEIDLSSGRFKSGAARGRWRVVSTAWPTTVIEISTSDGRWIGLRFDCSGYPEQAPTARPWDVAVSQPLERGKWPRGGRVSQVFNPDWQAGAALYIPCDRISIQGHSGWIAQYPDLIWRPARGILQYIEAVYEVLQSHELLRAA